MNQAGVVAVRQQQQQQQQLRREEVMPLNMRTAESLEFKMKRSRVPPNIPYVNLLKQNPTPRGVMPSFRTRSRGTASSRSSSRMSLA